jgi:DNA ligase 1
MSSFKFKPTKVCEITPDKFKYPVYATPKIDGVNAIVLGSKLYSRTLKDFKNKQLNQILSSWFLSGVCFEITVGKPENRLDDDICRKTTSYVNSFDKVAEDITISIFDFVGEALDSGKICQKNYLDRLVTVSKINSVSCVDGCNVHMEFLKPKLIEDEIDAEYFYNCCIDEGYEGAIYRRDMPYKCGRSTPLSQETIRMKPSADSEAIIIGFNEAMQNNNEKTVNKLGNSERSSHKANKTQKGMLGSFTCIDSISGETITVGAGKLSAEERIAVWKYRDQYAGKILKYRSMTAGVKDKPRFPRWINWREKEDMDLSKCHENFLDLV